MLSIIRLAQRLASLRLRNPSLQVHKNPVSGGLRSTQMPFSSPTHVMPRQPFSSVDKSTRAQGGTCKHTHALAIGTSDIPTRARARELGVLKIRCRQCAQRTDTTRVETALCCRVSAQTYTSPHTNFGTETRWGLGSLHRIYTSFSKP